MKIIRNSIMMLAILSIVGLGFSMDVSACAYTSGCYAVDKKVTCGDSEAPMVVSTHQVKESNGYTTTCTIRSFRTGHTITCSGCGHVYASGEVRTCSLIHTYRYCAPSNNMCQY